MQKDELSKITDKKHKTSKGLRLEELIEELWKETWNIIKVSDAYRQQLPLKECKPMLSVLFEAAMFKLVGELEKPRKR